MAVGAALVPAGVLALPKLAYSGKVVCLRWVPAPFPTDSDNWYSGVATLYKDEQRYINAIMRASLDRPEFEKALIHSIRRLT